MVSVMVIDGGVSNEREISHRSGAAICKALKESGYSVEEIDLKNDIDSIMPKLITADVVFPVLHGRGGEDGWLQKQLENRGITYIGSNSKASELCFNKHSYTELLQSRGIKCPETELVNLAEFKVSRLSRKPFVLKPIGGGSGIDVYIARELDNVNNDRVNELFKTYERMLLQELIIGREITVGVLNEKSLPVVEIIPPTNQEFDFENRYNGASEELCPPSNVDQFVQKQAQKLAEDIHQLSGCRDMSRTDMIVGDENQIFILETNTIPGFTDQSLLPKAAKAAGIDMPELVDLVVKAALGRKKLSDGRTA